VGGEATNLSSNVSAIENFYEHKDIALSSYLQEARGQAEGRNVDSRGIKAGSTRLVGPRGQQRANRRPEDECNSDWAKTNQSVKER